MTMFQVLTQKGWWEIMHHTMTQSKKFFPLVAVYFISYHLFVTLVRVAPPTLRLAAEFIYFYLNVLLNVVKVVVEIPLPPIPRPLYMCLFSWTNIDWFLDFAAPKYCLKASVQAINKKAEYIVPIFL